ncbi:hypothetical protein BU23DRAFT_564422 [Bimuria novae-zelandiae CBS 107.79]|uniref:NAD(P)-binding protein n=1 Tax=Bimuria novae-zelandiae CBS 107.79 TaxID=1447943 RepID=A0A6A5VLN0_9PLEO|nr:hypothetical protein BU23DRAFT_564422 [Bimuria novae-zelandiae CBS 107.79]
MIAVNRVASSSSSNLTPPSIRTPSPPFKNCRTTTQSTTLTSTSSSPTPASHTPGRPSQIFSLMIYALTCPPTSTVWWRCIKATRPLLKRAPREPIFSPLGSIAGCITSEPAIPNAAYSPSKAAMHWLTARINSEDAWLNAFVMDPGWAQMELGNTGARHFGLDQAPVRVEESCQGMVKAFSESTKEKHGGKMGL